MDKLLTVQEVANVLHCHQNTVYNNKEIPRLRIPGVGLRFREKDKKEWINKGATKNKLLFESFSKVDLVLDQYDTLFLKGESALNKKSKRWNYGFGGIRLRKTKNGIERYDIWIVQGGKRKYKVVPHARTREEAMLILESERRKILSNESGIPQRPKDVRFSHLAEQYVENYAKINNRAWERDRHCMKNMMSYFGDSYLVNINPFEVEKYKAHRLRQGVKPNTINRELSVLKRAFNLAISWNLAKENPVRKVKFFQQPEPKARVLSEVEERRLLNASADHSRPIVITALNTGMRLTEILSLRWNQVNLKKREIEVIKTKSGKKRIIPINDVLFETLSELKREGDFVFLYRDPKTNIRRPVKSIKRSFSKSCTRAKIENLTFHDLRHTFASRLVEKGVDLIVVKELLGHASVKTTERYTHTQKEAKRKAVKSLAPEPVNAENLLTICTTGEDIKFKEAHKLLIVNN